ncbi:MAG: DUF928 domain-containing protein [Spirulina sp.]
MKHTDSIGNYRPMFQPKLAVAFLFTILWFCLPSAAASYTPDDPETSPSPREGSSVGGVRGCFSPTLVLFASRSYLDKTALSRPQFSWFISSLEPVDIIFRLHDSDDRLIVEAKKHEVRSGIMTFAPFDSNKPGLSPTQQDSWQVMTFAPFDSNELELSPNQQYSWQVTLYCDRDRPGEITWERVDFKVVERPPRLIENLANTRNRCDRSNLYARAGLWYEAIAEALPPAQNNTVGILGASLLEDIIRLEERQTLPEEDPEAMEAESKQIKEIWEVVRQGRENPVLSCQ